MKLIILLLFPFVLFASEKYDFRYDVYRLPRVENDRPTHMVFANSMPKHNNGWGHLDKKLNVICKEKDGNIKNSLVVIDSQEYDCVIPQGVTTDRIVKESNGLENVFYYIDTKNYEIVTVDLSARNSLLSRVKNKKQNRIALLKSKISEIDTMTVNQLKQVLKALMKLSLHNYMTTEEQDQD